ncbi:protein HEXIM-like [Limulus polyphemus]|uniref:Protein HEXIM-like n=1 Tax=Limulus polyphemus TaxID=6850 RepID=A0ABM1T6D5_LIMPO|nr:protein HEXIM-like [Limulus polyphemus]XP_022251442.1 protein HEXIM-like [Limulus polyphemus]XP_022251443.1 protein HEXIM-like [Limulus polyphemus]
MADVDVICHRETFSRDMLGPAEDAGSESTSRPIVIERQEPSSGYDENNCDQQSSQSEGNDAEGQKGMQRKRKSRRGKYKHKKRKWKPYYKLSWQERREVDERETMRANRVREVRFAHGQALAPYNTTQFLMDDHNVQEPDYEHINNGHRHIQKENVGDSSDEFYSSPEDEEDFLQQQFCEAYEDVHAERLNSMSKNDLVQEYIQLEDKVEELEVKLRDAKAKVCVSSNKSVTDSEVQTPCTKESEQWEKTRIFREEITKLLKENQQLKNENEKLRNMVKNQWSYFSTCGRKVKIKRVWTDRS